MWNDAINSDVHVASVDRQLSRHRAIDLELNVFRIRKRLFGYLLDPVVCYLLVLFNLGKASFDLGLDLQDLFAQLHEKLAGDLVGFRIAETEVQEIGPLKGALKLSEKGAVVKEGWFGRLVHVGLHICGVDGLLVNWLLAVVVIHILLDWSYWPLEVIYSLTWLRDWKLVVAARRGRCCFCWLSFVPSLIHF